jgi:hypothetical protein
MVANRIVLVLVVVLVLDLVLTAARRVVRPKRDYGSVVDLGKNGSEDEDEKKP